MNKIIGQFLLWTGFLSGSLATVWNASSDGVKFVKELTPEEATENRVELVDLSGVQIPVEGWDLIPWNWYFVSIAVSVVGIVLIRVGRMADTQQSHHTEASLTEIVAALARLIENVSQLSSETEKLAPSEVVRRIEDVLADDLRIFADGRNSITAEYGLDVFADIMTQFASGERSINRAWSASADGYVDEAATCIQRGEKMFRQAQQIFENTDKLSV